MPIYSYRCITCQHVWDELRHSSEADDRAECSKCDSNSPGERRVTAFGGYSGNTGSSSTRPRGAGSKRGGEKLNFEKKGS